MFHPLPSSAWADGTLAEVAEQVGKMMELPKSKSTQPRFARRCRTPVLRQEGAPFPSHLLELLGPLRSEARLRSFAVVLRVDHSWLWDRRDSSTPEMVRVFACHVCNNLQGERNIIWASSSSSYLGKRVCKMFSESSTTILNLPFWPGKGNELSIVYKNSYPSYGPS